MKKVCSLLLCIALLSSCSPAYQPIEDPISNYDNESRYEIQINPESDNPYTGESQSTAENTQIGEFSVKVKKYSYNENDLLIFDIQNITDTDCDLTITVQYFDKNNQTLGTESQTFNGFAAEYRNYFLFSPNKAFEDFEYQISATKATNDCPAKNVLFEWTNNFEEIPFPSNYKNGDYKKYPTIVAKSMYKNNNSCSTIIVDIKIILDENGNVYKICERNETMLMASAENYKTILVYSTTEEPFVWPEEIDDGGSVIIAVQSVIAT